MTLLPDEAWLVALSMLPEMGPARLAALLAARSPSAAWDAVREGQSGVDPGLAHRWASAARAADPEALWRRHVDGGVSVLSPRRRGWPGALLDDPEPPVVLFARGRLELLELPTVAVVGTRRCTGTGRLVARELGRDLAEAGVCVLSGLALGIDGEAHEGALATGGAPVAGVVGSGLDVVYPRRHRALWDRVAAEGLLLSEYPLGTPPARWRFPARNRILAALADVVVVVESRVAGGSMHTVEAAIERDRAVMAVPGSVRSAASAGCNALLAAGVPPVRDATDVLVALGLDASGVGRRHVEHPPEGDAGRVLDAVGWEAVTLEQVADRLGAPLGPVAVHLVELERSGWISQRGGWYERVR